MMGSLPSGWMRKVLLFLVLITGILLIALYSHAPMLANVSSFAPRRNGLKFFQRQLIIIQAVNDTIESLELDELYKYLNHNRTFHTPWSWDCINRRCERRAVKSSRTSFATCTALCGGNDRLLWPKPTGDVILTDSSVELNLQQIQLVTINTSDQEVKNLLEHAKDVFIGNMKNLVKAPNNRVKSTIDKFIIYLTAGDAQGTKLTLDTDESYKLEIGQKQHNLECKITGKTYQGVRHGLETLSQMIWWDDTSDKQSGLRVLSSVLVTDKPAFHYRGLLIDTARQFFTIDQLKRALDGMAASKLNTFHWHITDSQSFPYDSPAFPQMARWGAYSAEETYTPEDIKDLVEYARIRGIRIIIEIDSPAHASAGWQWGLEHGVGELALCLDQQPWSSFCGEPNCGQLNPINKNTLKILGGLYKELLDLTEVRDIIHLGGDEVNLDCWAQYGNITQAMQAMNFTDIHSLWADFEMKLLQKIIEANHGQQPKAVVLWSSPLTKRPWLTTNFSNKLHVIQSWGGSSWPETGELLEDGFQVILSHVDAWYFDCGFGKWRETGEAACGEYRTWQTAYNHRPWKEYHNSRHLIMGGEAALWSEQVGQGSLGPRLWPRASAFAERFWTDPPTSSYSTDENVYTRLASHMELLKARGLKTESMWPQWCSQNPGKCL